MAIIKNLAFYNKSILKDLVSYVGYDSFLTGYPIFPFALLNHIMPLRLKFAQEAFVVCSNNKIKGLISLQKEQGNYKKLKINKFFLDSNSTDEGIQLVDYVVARYSAMGANSFQIVVDENHTSINSLLVNSCKFRISSVEYLYKVNCSCKNNQNISFEKLNNSRADEIADFYNNLISSHLRPIFAKNSDYFKEKFIKFNHSTSFSYIFADFNKNQTYGFFTISTNDEKNYILDCTLDYNFMSYLDEIVAFSYFQILKRGHDNILYLRIKNYFQNAKYFVDFCEEQKMELVRKNLILTRNSFNLAQSQIVNRKILFDALVPEVN